MRNLPVLLYQQAVAGGLNWTLMLSIKYHHLPRDDKVTGRVTTSPDAQIGFDRKEDRGCASLELVMVLSNLKTHRTPALKLWQVCA